MSETYLTIPKVVKGNVKLPLSKSECNRLLIIHALATGKADIPNISDAQDSRLLHALLQQSAATESDVFDAGPAGTTMRFLTAYFSLLPGKRVLTGTARMQKRPIGVLVNALRELGAKITYLGEDGYPPLQIEGGVLRGGEIEVDGSISSQFISALLMIGPMLHNGLVIRFKGPVVSRPYINMTIRIMERFHVYAIWDSDTLSVSNQRYIIDDPEKQFYVEPDWSAASYWYSIAALADEADIFLEGLKKESLQADAVTALIYPFLGVSTVFEDKGVRLTKNHYRPQAFAFDFEDCPDIVQTVAVTAAAKKIPVLMRGLNTLRTKETDRINALKTELHKFGVITSEPHPGVLEIKEFSDVSVSDITVSTYEDHRMAMAFAPMAVKFPRLHILHPDVVSKSYPEFWQELNKVGALSEH